MKKQTLGIVAGAAGAALLLGGSTFALWSDSGTAPGGTITSGNLDVAVLDSAWVDDSADRTDSPHAIDLDTFKIVPGDTIAGKFGIDVGLEGENLVADLALTTPDSDNLSGDLAPGLSLEYSVEDAAGTVLATGDSTGVSLDISSPDNGNPGSLPVSTPDADGTADFYVVVTATFDPATTNQDLVRSQATLASAGITLSQVRDGQGFA